MSERNLVEVVREARAASAALRKATQDLEQSIGDLEAAIAALGLGGPARVYLLRGVLAFRPFGEARTYRLVVEDGGSMRRGTRLLVTQRGELLARAVAALPELLAELTRGARERAAEAEARTSEVRAVRDGLPKSDPGSAPK